MDICIYHLADDQRIIRSLILKIYDGYHIYLNSIRKKYLVGALGSWYQHQRKIVVDIESNKFKVCQEDECQN